MGSNPTTPTSFVRVDSWEAAEPWLGFAPRVPGDTLDLELASLSVFVRDHRMREVAPEERSLEAHYGGFVFTQSRPGTARAAGSVRQVSYGSAPQIESVAGREARAYARGPRPAPDDPDPRMPSVVVWSDGPLFYLLASEELDTESLLRVARSLHP